MTLQRETKGENKRRERKTRIVATLCPASSSMERIKELFEAGVEVFRLNMSHRDHKDKEALIHNLRQG